MYKDNFKVQEIGREIRNDEKKNKSIMKFSKGKELQEWNNFKTSPMYRKIAHKIMKTKIEKLQDALTEVCNVYGGFKIVKNNKESIYISRDTNVFSHAVCKDIIETTNILDAKYFFDTDGNILRFVAYYE